MAGKDVIGRVICDVVHVTDFGNGDNVGETFLNQVDIPEPGNCAINVAVCGTFTGIHFDGISSFMGFMEDRSTKYAAKVRNFRYTII